MQYANYCSLLLALLLIIMVYDAYFFVKTGLSNGGKRAWGGMPSWLQPIVLMAPPFCAVNFVVCSFLIFQHVERIREETAVHRHDRAVQIVLLPTVYSTMAFASLTRIYFTLSKHADPYSVA